MRTISPEQRQTLEDLSAEGLLKQLPLQTAEKDVHITDLLKELSELVVHHGHFSDLRRDQTTRPESGIQLIFAGGTCLSKAHGLIERMSEDIDIKVILHPTKKPLKKGRSDRSRLVALHELLPALFVRMDLSLSEYETGANPHIRDRHRYWAVGAGYASAYSQLPSLRSELKLKLIHRAPLLPVEMRNFGYLHETLAGLEPSVKVSIPCISVAETAAEKVLSLLRRCAYRWDGCQKEPMDPVLVRHVYDVASIATKAPGVLPAGRDAFARLMAVDQMEFKGQNPEFDADPVGVLTRTLASARANGELRQRYNDTLLPLVYEKQPPTFERAFASFENVAQDFLSAC